MSADQPETVLRALVEFSDTLAADFHVAGFLHGLSVRCVDLLDVDAAAVMLADPARTLRYAASSSEAASLVELVETQDADGPCLDAYRLGRMTVSTSSDDAVRRWPRFGTRARDAGYESVVGVPLRVRDDSIGALNLLARRPGGLTDQDQYVVQALADIATIGVVQARALADASIVTAQLQTALASRITIEQAKGIVAERMSISVEEAFNLLRRHARGHNTKLAEVAAAVVAGTLRPQALVAAGSQRRR